MIRNDEEYKKNKLEDLDFPRRLYNAAKRNGINTLYDLIESYNTGEFANLHNVGENTVKILENYFGSSIPSLSNVDDEGAYVNSNGSDADCIKEFFLNIQNNEEYKKRKIEDIGFSNRLCNAAKRNKIYTLYDLIDSYNSGVFVKLRNVGKKTVEEFENYDFASMPPFVDSEKEGAFEHSKVNPIDEVNWDKILPATYLDSSIEKNILDDHLITLFYEHDKKNMRDLLKLSDDTIMEWLGDDQINRHCLVELRNKAINGEESVIIGGKVKSFSEIKPSREIDWRVYNILKNEYGLKNVWLCDWYGVSRQCVDQKIKKASRRSAGKWCGFGCSETEEKIILEMLKKGQTEYYTTNEFYYFLTNDKGRFALLFVDKVGIRCMFDEEINGDLKNYILTNRLNELSIKEIDIISNGTEVSILKVKYFVPNDKDMLRFAEYAKKRKMSKEDYAIFLTGKPFISDFKITDTDIIEFFEKHLDEQGRVYISADRANQWIKSYASRKGYKILDFIKLYGYQSALDGDQLTTEGAKRRHLEEIKNYVIHDNVVYIPAYCSFYRILNGYSSKKRMTVTEYIAELGYKRTLMPDSSSDNEDIICSDETDMEIYTTEGSYLEKVFAANPLLGNFVFSENNLQILHNKAKKAIDVMVTQRGANHLNQEQKLAIALSVINYAKHWDTGVGSFTNYITKQYAYRSEDKVYPKIMTATYEALRDSGRWTFYSHGSIHYKSTVMIHAMGTTRSWMHLCDFLSDFYQDNLGTHFVENDPCVLNMVMYMRGLLYNSELDSDDEREVEINVGKKFYRFQEGIRKLIVYRPNYAAKVFDRMLKRIHNYMNFDVSPSKCYEEKLVDLWFKNKTEYYFKYKRNIGRREVFVPRKVALDYTQIHPSYTFVDDMVYIDIPDIRLDASSEGACFFEIYDQHELVDKRSLKCYGNELGWTIAGFSYSLNDFLSISEEREIAPRIMIKCGDRVVYDSENKFKRKIIIFNGGREKELSAVEVGTYAIVSALGIAIEGASVETNIIKTIGKFKIQLIDLLDDYSLVIDDTIVSFDHNRTEKLRVYLPYYVKGASYVEEGLEYSICKSNGEITIAIDENDAEQRYVILLNGHRISFSELKCNYGEGMTIYSLSSQAWKKDKNRFQVVDFSSNKIIVDKWFIFIPSFTYEFDSDYYYSEHEIKECCLVYSIGGEEYEITNEGTNTILSVEYLNGEIQFEIPIIRLIDLDGKDWKNEDYYIKEIDRGLYLKLNAVSGVDGRILLGDLEIQRDMRGLFSLGNTLYSLTNLKDSSVKLLLTGLEGVSKTYDIGRILFKEQFVAKPTIEYMDGRLMWNCGYGFIGDKSKKTFIQITNEGTDIIYEGTLDLENSLITECLFIPDGLYNYTIFRESEDLFSFEKSKLAQGCFVCGNYDKVRFNNSRIVISQIVFDNAIGIGVINITPIYIDNIKYSEELSLEEGSEGVCPTYFGIMYYINREGKRCDYAFDEEINEKVTRVKTNPVKIVYINDNVLLVTDCDDDALMYRFFYDKHAQKTIYRVTDHKPRDYNRDYYDSVDLLRYKKESI